MHKIKSVVVGLNRGKNVLKECFQKKKKIFVKGYLIVHRLAERVRGTE